MESLSGATVATSIDTTATLEKITQEELNEIKGDLEKKKTDLPIVTNLLKVLMKKQITLDLLK